MTFPLTKVVPVVVEATRVPFRDPHPILGDVRVRQAIAYCTDRAALLRSVYPWLTDTAAFEADAIVPRGHWAHPGEAASFARYPFDPARGRALLEEAGWSLAEGAEFRTNAAGDELALTLTTTNAAIRLMWGAVFEEQMKACGLRLVRLHAPGTWLFGNATGLRHRDFEIAAFAWVAESDPNGRTLWACDAIPLPENGWSGQNYTGWCNAAADAAIRTATQTLERETRRAAYRTVQDEMAREVPVLPLFFRAELYAVHAGLENFAPDSSEPVHTWNAAQWRLPGRDTIVIGADAEPASLFTPVENAYVAQVIAALVKGVAYTRRNFDYQPVMLSRIPSLENGAVQQRLVDVRVGEPVVDGRGRQRGDPSAGRPSARRGWRYSRIRRRHGAGAAACGDLRVRGEPALVRW